jgi:hypothetical protein
MNCRKLIALSSIALVGAVVLLGSLAAADDPSKDAKPAAANMPEMKLPPGWTQEDMQACAAAATPGKMHEQLKQYVGTWYGKTTMWMAPGTEAQNSECTGTYSPMLDGRFVKCEMSGDMPGMGPFNGFGVYGFDNVSQKFQATWIDNCGTGMMTGTGQLSDDGKTMTWTFNYNCPIAKKQVSMREVDTLTSSTTRKMEMFGPDPKTGKEYKMMAIEFTKR